VLRNKTTKPSTAVFSGKKAVFEEAESRRVFDATAKNVMRGKSDTDAGGAKLQGGVSFGFFSPIKEKNIF
jgi:hypothetical protein